MNWNERYVCGDLPWETGREDRNLHAAIEQFNIQPCRTLELGCGTGNNAVWLAKMGFSVTAVDVAEEAVRAAQAKAVKNGVSIEFSCNDLTLDAYPAGPFGFVFDRGCFHSFSEQEERIKLASGIRRRMNPGAYWLSIIGSTDGPDRDEGPPRLSAREVASSVEKYFEIISLQSTEFDSDRDARPRAWLCLMMRREKVI